MTIKKDLKTENLKRPNYTDIPAEKQENARIFKASTHPIS
jgi:hypothetical protein